MARGELFDISEIQQCRQPLCRQEQDAVAREIIRSAKMGMKYFYTIKETCGILHCSYDELMTTIAMYRLDVILFRSAYRISWWDLAGYILDGDDDLEDALDEYLQKIARRDSGKH